MIFVTIGSFGPFDRMLELVDALAADHPDEQWFAQIGDSSYLPKHMEYERYIDKQDFDKRIEAADVLIGHAGMGTIAAAITFVKPLIVIPRNHKLGEHVDDHQLATAELFSTGHHVLVAHNSQELRRAWLAAPSFRPEPRQSTAEAVGERVGQFLRQQFGSR